MREAVITDTRPSWFYSGLFLLCMSVLMLQITETRILSVIAYYYLAFLTISMAMFGMTAGALIVYFKQDTFDPKWLAHHLTWTASAYAVVLVISFLLQMAAVWAVTSVVATTVIIWTYALLLLAVPFVFAGMAVSLALTRSPFKIGLVYGIDLIGAASGCLVVLGLLNTVDGPSAMFSIAAIAAAAAFCFSRAGVAPAPVHSAWYWMVLKRPGLLTAIFLVLGILNASTTFGIRPVMVKNHLENPRDFSFEKWNSFSRIVAYKSVKGPPAVWGASPIFDWKVRVESRNLNIDGFAGTHMPRFKGDLESVSYLAQDVTNLAYYIRSRGKSAVVGVGSGRDLLSAYLFGFRDVIGVELNPIFVGLLQNRNELRDYAGIADLPGIRLVVEEGRSWFARTSERFDLIQMSMIDTFASTGAGAFSLSENGLYTVEAWKIFLSALEPTGIFTVSRWHSAESPVEIGRALSLALAALFSLGADDPKSHIFLVNTGPLATIIVGRSPLSDSDVRGLTEASEKLQYTVLMSPGRPIELPVFNDLAAANGLNDLEIRAQRYPLDLSAPTDAHPFFFNQLRMAHPQDWLEMIANYRRSGHFHDSENLVIAGNMLAIGTLFLLIVLSAILVVVVIVMPGRSSMRIADRNLVWSGTAYFLLIGIGFMLVEIGLIQRMSIFIGHPVYGLSIVLFSIILATGIGSFLSERLAPSTKAHFAIWLGTLGLYLLILPYWLPGLTHSMESAALLVRAVVSVAVILPAGVLMGFGFPTGMRLVDRRDPRPTPWFWGINGAAGVMAAGIGVMSSIAFSINTTTQLGGLCYLLLCPAAILLLAHSEPTNIAKEDAGQVAAVP